MPENIRFGTRTRERTLVTTSDTTGALDTSKMVILLSYPAGSEIAQDYAFAREEFHSWLWFVTDTITVPT
jgi:hypothetical protein